MTDTYGLDPPRFVVLDDESDMEHLFDRLVKPNRLVGLSELNADRAIGLLSGPLNRSKSDVKLSSGDVDGG